MLKSGTATAQAAFELLGSFGCGLAGWRGAIFTLAVGFGPVGLFPGKPDLALAAIDAKDFDLDLVAHFDDFLGAIDFVVGEL